MSILKVQSISKSFDGLQALEDVSFDVKSNEIVGIIGPNGAGKSTLFNVIGGFTRPDTGVIKFDGQDITGVAPHKIARQGMIKTFQLVKPFGSLTLKQNIMIPKLLKGLSISESMLQSSSILERFGLVGMADLFPNELPYALRRRLEIARAFASDPKILLLDEALAGLTQNELSDIMDILKKMRHDGITILMIEHVMAATMELCDRIVVLNFGKLIATGTPNEVTQNQLVIEAYLGKGS